MSASDATTPSLRVRRLPWIRIFLDRFGIALALIILMVILAILSPESF